VCPQLSESSGILTDADREALDALRGFVASNGHPDVPMGFITDDGLRLGRWIASMRRRARAKTLSDELRSVLEQIHHLSLTPHTGDHADEVFESMLQQLIAFESVHGHCLPPRGTLTSDGIDLHDWVAAQQQHHTQGTLPARYGDRLDTISTWRWSQPSTRWARGLAALRRYAQDHRSTAVPRDFVTDDGFPLGGFVHELREDYSRGALPRGCVVQACAIDVWAWSYTEARWEAGYAALMSYVADHNAPPPRSYRSPNGLRVGEWFSKQKRAIEDGELARELVDRFEQLLGRDDQASRSVDQSSANSGGRSTNDWIGLIELYVKRTGIHSLTPNTFVLNAQTKAREPIGHWYHTAQADGTLTPSQRREISRLLQA